MANYSAYYINNKIWVQSIENLQFKQYHIEIAYVKSFICLKKCFKNKNTSNYTFETENCLKMCKAVQIMTRWRYTRCQSTKVETVFKMVLKITLT